jgi:two-component system sensor histidine kinase KdpD
MAHMLKLMEETLLVCASPGPSSTKLINAAEGMATSLHAKWFAIYVEEPKMAILPEAERSLVDNPRLAEQLGGKLLP